MYQLGVLSSQQSGSTSACVLNSAVISSHAG
jgi:hypothetical protein